MGLKNRDRVIFQFIRMVGLPDFDVGFRQSGESGIRKKWFYGSGFMFYIGELVFVCLVSVWTVRFMTSYIEIMVSGVEL